MATPTEFGCSGSAPWSPLMGRGKRKRKQRAAARRKRPTAVYMRDPRQTGPVGVLCLFRDQLNPDRAGVMIIERPQEAPDGKPN